MTARILYDIPGHRTGEAADAAADAFIGAPCPIGTFIFRNEPNPEALQRRYYRSHVTAYTARALIQGTSPCLEAVHIWFPPGVDHSGEDTDCFSTENFRDPGTKDRLQAIDDVIEMLTDTLYQEPHWYLHLVAVRPQFTGRGYASRLIRPILARASREGVPCFLITQTLQNVEMYRHWGFAVVEEMRVPGSGEMFCSMRKD